MRSVKFPSTIPVIDLVSEHPPFSDSGDIARWKDCHRQFVAGQPNREGITAYGTTHYIFRDNPPLVIHAIAKAYAGAMGEPEASAIMERDQAYAIVAANDMMRQQTAYQHSESILNSWGYTFLERGERKRAINVFKLNTALAPTAGMSSTAWRKRMKRTGRRHSPSRTTSIHWH